MSALHRNGLPFTLLTVFLLAGWVAGTARASNVRVLYSYPFSDDYNVNQKGAYPFAAPVQAKDGSLYGVTYWGGKFGDGVIYKLAPDGAFTVLHTFGVGTRGADGARPYDILTIGLEGDLYGTAPFGGAAGEGVVFRITPSGEYTLLHVFRGSDGANPYGRLVKGPEGAFYGITSGGGTYGNGVIYKITPTGALTVLHSLSNAEGAFALGGLTPGRDGAFYGATGNGGANGNGTVFKITPGGIFTVLHTFSAMQEARIHQTSVRANYDGAHPFPGLVQARDGNFYGVTQFGGWFGSGAVYRVRPDGAFTILHYFSLLPLKINATNPLTTSANLDGAYPKAALIEARNGRLYGAAGGGGANGCGTIFSVSLTGEFALAHTFSRISDPPYFANGDGAQPRGIALSDNGTIYGTAFTGGAAGNGVIYRLETGDDRPLPGGFDSWAGDADEQDLGSLLGGYGIYRAPALPRSRINAPSYSGRPASAPIRRSPATPSQPRSRP